MPPLRNPWLASLLAALYSLGLSAWSVVAAMALTGWSLGPANGGFNDWPSFVTFFGHTWFAGVLGLVFSIGPYARARQGFTAAKGENAAPPEQNQPLPNPTS
jgi:hypothetical protein